MSQFRDFLPVRQFRERGLDREQEWQMHLDQMSAQDDANKMAKIGMILDAVKTVGSLGTGIAGLSQGQQQIDLAKEDQKFEQNIKFPEDKRQFDMGQRLTQRLADTDTMKFMLELSPERYADQRSTDVFGMNAWMPESLSQPRLGIGDYAAGIMGSDDPVRIGKMLQWLNRSMSEGNLDPDFNELERFDFDPRYADLRTAINEKTNLPASLRANLPTESAPTPFKTFMKGLGSALTGPSMWGRLPFNEQEKFEEFQRLWTEYLKSRGMLPE